MASFRMRNNAQHVRRTVDKARDELENYTENPAARQRQALKTLLSEALPVQKYRSAQRSAQEIADYEEACKLFLAYKKLLAQPWANFRVGILPPVVNISVAYNFGGAQPWATFEVGIMPPVFPFPGRNYPACLSKAGGPDPKVLARLGDRTQKYLMV